MSGSVSDSGSMKYSSIHALSDMLSSSSESLSESVPASHDLMIGSSPAGMTSQVLATGVPSSWYLGVPSSK